MRCHIHHTTSSMRSMVVIEVSKEFELISVFMYINKEWVFSYMFPECSMVSFYLSIMFRSIWRIFLVFYFKFHEKFRESLSKLTSTIRTNHLYFCRIVRWCLEKIPNELHTRSYTMFWVCIFETMNLLQSSIASCCTLGLVLQNGKHTSSCTSCSGTSREYLFKLFIPHLSYNDLISLEDSVYCRLIDSLSCNTFYSPWEFSCTHLWHLTSKSAYFFFQMEWCFVVYIKSYSSIRKSSRFRSWTNRNKSSISAYTKPRYPLRYWLSRHMKALCYFGNSFLLLKYISYCLYLHSNIFFTLESRST